MYAAYVARFDASAIDADGMDTAEPIGAGVGTDTMATAEPIGAGVGTVTMDTVETVAEYMARVNA